MLEQLQAELASGLVSVAGAALAVLFGFAMNYLKKKADKIKNDTLRKALKESFEEAERVGTLSIRAVKQNMVEDLKKKAEDGKLTPQEKHQALQRAKEVFINNLSQESINTLEKEVGELNNWLGSFLEGKLKEEKDIEKQVLNLSDPK